MKHLIVSTKKNLNVQKKNNEILVFSFSFYHKCANDYVDNVNVLV